MSLTRDRDWLYDDEPPESDGYGYQFDEFTPEEYDELVMMYGDEVAAAMYIVADEDYEQAEADLLQMEAYLGED